MRPGEGGGSAEKVGYTVLTVAPGAVAFSAGPAGLRRVVLGPYRDREALDWAAAVFPGQMYNPRLLPELQESLREYFSGRPVVLKAPLDLRGLTGFQVQALRACAAIPYGQTRTYAELAREIGRPRACRAVGAAMARNPFPIVIPCHRVLAADGSPGGYSAEQGVALKRWLLDLERGGGHLAGNLRAAHREEW